MRFSEYDIMCVKKTKALIDSDLTRHLRIDLLASISGIGKTKLKKGFKQLYGTGIFTYLRHQRMIKAAELLINTDKSIKEIAQTVGFKYTTNFISAFLDFHGHTPFKYRNFPH